ncbi:MAG: ATP-binding cassette domain-containing protein [Devosia nanyangense]|jgi:oligopeptide transport system ATP-binding protein|uniref:ATP-binding cassette domain-containing protein n=1 Tax=Paradevosia shaoguanensis TaxID=1335043 RepID=A0AA41UD25_9HYPH|nr:oligopeptide/dipeptide ABC transporter ATP-binding protein [Paradevosia shaoguanensis]KFL26086.1 peptide ABC transporter ATP-binding protein [Devosia sp. 17-2-E-8]MBI4046043.1 ATP-binding cassette domain-containing protein [Devosia nanyangense]CDP52882.1 Oligopeptide transport ATP-binding protein OppF [Devosia sp. DBB001]MCF1744482.1 ATP-binding cassette domain-containing protein [Paradevosia shaoguanensis]MCI0128965.1 ATP-binding cassette domain-containing protein [Paradevosia shaoguanensi
MTELLRIDGLKKTFSIANGLFGRPLTLTALEDISFSVQKGETLGIVGESGSGKSTLGRCILQLLSPDQGKVLWLGQDLTRLPDEEMRRKRRDLQIIFQDPLASLNPRMTVGEIIADPLRTLMPELNREQRRAKVIKMMEAVGLLPEMINRYPHEFSGGQAQRIGIARALITEPKLIVCDEPVSALDVSIQAQILNLLSELKDEFGLTLIFISHNLSVVRHVSDRILVLYLGRIVEMAKGDDIYDDPKHPYTRALLTAVPIPDPRLARERNIDALRGEIPSPINPPSGCTFRTRCRFAKPICAEVRPALETLAGDRLVACHRWRDLDLEHPVPSV